MVHMRITEMNWSQVEEYLRHDDRCVLPIGSTEQHSFLSLSTDSLLAERVSIEAAEPIGVAVFPVVAYGLTPYFMAYPGTITLSETTYFALLTDILNSLVQHGFKRIVIVNGHGGNSPAQAMCERFMREHPERNTELGEFSVKSKDVRIKWRNWWNAPHIWAKVQAIDPVASHASWMENFPWTRLKNVALPNQPKPMIDPAHVKTLSPIEARKYLGDGNYGGLYQRSDDEMLALWQIGVEETREVIEEDWE
jgi:creatinine amidohydrolase